MSTRDYNYLARIQQQQADRRSKVPHYAIIEDALMELSDADMDAVVRVPLPPNSWSFSTKNDDICHCDHPLSEHRVSAYGSTCAVPCGHANCFCVRSFALADVPADVQPFPGQKLHPRAEGSPQ